MKLKKAQVTVFIILGLIVLMASLFFIYVKQKAQQVTPEITVPEKFIPAKDYVEFCLDTVARDALARIGMQGGFIEKPPNTMTGLNYLSFSRETEAGIPYWYFNGVLKYPTVEQMQEGISSYVEENLEECLANFTDLKDIFNIDTLGKPLATTVIAEDDVSVQLEYPVSFEVKSEREKIKMKDFSTTVPVRLKRLYEFARKILNRENEEMFLEKELFSLMVLSPEIPISDVKFQCTPLVKSISGIKETLKQIASYNIGDVRINNTRYSRFLDEDKKYANLHLTWDIGIGVREYDDVAVTFSYEPAWPLLMNIAPSQGAYLKAVPVRLFFLLPTCFLQYHYVYDIQMPVRISLVDFDAPDHDAYQFDFAIPLLINHNKPDRVENPPFSGYPSEIYDAEFCENAKTVPITFEAMNAFNREPLVHINLTARCANYECFLGEILPKRDTYILEAEVPDCEAVTVIGRGEGFLESETFFDLDDYDGQPFLIEMKPIEKVKAFVVKHEKGDPGLVYDLGKDDLVVISIVNMEHEYDYFTLYPAPEGETTLELLGDGNHKYALEMNLIKDDKLIGGYKGNWTPDWDQLRTAEDVRMHVFFDGTVLENEDKQLDLIVNMTKYSKKLPKPEFES